MKVAGERVCPGQYRYHGLVLSRRAFALHRGIMNLMAADGEAVVPVLWPYEVANVLLLAVRRSRIPPARPTEFIEDLESFRITVDDGIGYAFNKVDELAEQHRLTAYDAAYLELALRKGLPLASLVPVRPQPIWPSKNPG